MKMKYCYINERLPECAIVRQNGEDRVRLPLPLVSADNQEQKEPRHAPNPETQPSQG
jgi:hypothetical protein